MSKGHTSIFARAYYPRPNNVSHVAVGRTMCHAAIKSTGPSIRASSDPQSELTLIEPLCPYYHHWKRSRSNGGKLVNSIHFSLSTRKAWSTINKLTWRSGCSFHQCPVPANSILSQRVKNGAHRTGGRESSRFINQNLFDLRKIPTPEDHSISDSFRPVELAAALSCLDWIPFSRSLYSTPGRLSNLGFGITSLPACANSKFQTSREEHQ